MLQNRDELWQHQAKLQISNFLSDSHPRNAFRFRRHALQVCGLGLEHRMLCPVMQSTWYFIFTCGINLG